MTEEWSMTVGIELGLVIEHPSTSIDDLDNYALCMLEMAPGTCSGMQD